MNDSSKPNLQIGIIATRRPELLKTMLDSFQNKLFSNFHITSVHVNIDPAFGTKKDEKYAIDNILSHFSFAKIRTPDRPSFGAAVKWSWLQFNPGLALHLEDDWQLDQKIFPEDVFPKLTNGYSAVSLCGNHAKWYKRKKYLWLHSKRTRFPWLGYEKIPALGTQPKFIEGAFANEISKLIDPELDPEKQMHPNFGDKFSTLIKYNKCGFLDKSGNKQYGVLTELGRDWRAQRNIRKVVVNGRSEWRGQ